MLIRTTLFLLLALFVAQAAAAPAGLYALDSAQGVYRDANIRDNVAGYAWRMSWADFEPEKGQYDFAGLEHIVTELAGRNLKLAFLLGGSKLPAYLLDEAATYDANGTLMPSPFDPVVQERYSAFLRAMSRVRIPDPARNGRSMPFSRHSVNHIFHPIWPGLPMGNFRENSQVMRIKDVPGYTRDALINDVLIPNLEIATRFFPKQVKYIHLWRINDDEPGDMWADIAEVAAGYGYGFWMDNLSAVTPTFPFGDPLLYGDFTGFQMLGNWANTAPQHEQNLAGTTVQEGVEYGCSLGALYMEIYVGDLDANPGLGSCE